MRARLASSSTRKAAWIRLASVFAQDAGIPAVMIGNTDGVALKNYLAANPGATAALDLTFAPVSAAANAVWPESSRGPSIGNFGSTPTFVIKPELVAPGADLYTAAQKLDPNGDAYNATGYTSVTGTSYAVPMVAGAVALVKQNHSTWKPAQLKSAVVNTATQDVTDGGVAASVNAVGAGKLSVGDAVNVAATLDPATISFGAIGAGALPIRRTLNITNVGASTATFNFAVAAPQCERNCLALQHHFGAGPEQRDSHSSGQPPQPGIVRRVYRRYRRRTYVARAVPVFRGERRAV